MNLLATSEITAPVRKWKPYPAYKDSGTKWLGVIPQNWEVKRIKFLASFYGGGTPSKENLDYWNGDIPWVSPKDMKTEVVNDSEDHITKEALAGSATHLVQPGAVLVVVRSGILKHSIPVAINVSPVTLNQDMKAMVPRSDLSPDYLKYLIVGHQEALLVEWRKTGATVESIEHELLVNSCFPIPPLAEQLSIIDLLDRETTEIDGLVAKKERLIELLQEKRAALITRAVTKGLDPNVSMKDSGVEWLGEIPAHWEVKQFRHCCSISEGQIDPRSESFNDRVLIAPNHIESGTGRILFTETAEEQGAISGKYLVREGEIIYSKIRPALNKACVAGGDWLCSADMYPIRINEDLLSRFFLYYVLSEPFVRLMVDESMRVAMPKINRDKLKSCPILLPPATEQKKITDFVDYEVRKIDSLITKIREGIEKLNEYRTALISATVTGKIDVREEFRSAIGDRLPRAPHA